MEKTKAILRDIEQERINQICRSNEIDKTGNAAWELKEMGMFNYETILQIAATAIEMMEQLEEE